MPDKQDRATLAESRVVPHMAVQERVERGKAARKNCPDSVHAAWNRRTSVRTKVSVIG
jgi:hypothetical protein